MKHRLLQSKRICNKDTELQHDENGASTRNTDWWAQNYEVNFTSVVIESTVAYINGPWKNKARVAEKCTYI